MKMTNNIYDWKIVKSKSNEHPHCGYPLGEVLCRNLQEAQDYIKKCEFKDCYIEDYHDVIMKYKNDK